VHTGFDDAEKEDVPLGAITDVTKASFSREVLEAGQLVLVDFWAQWSGPCRHLEPILDDVAQDLRGIKLCRINVEREPELAGVYHVAATPTLMLFENGIKQRVSTGSRSKQNILDVLGGAQYECID
jgi:thioredoxin 1